MSQKLEKLSKELQKARAKYEEWASKVKALENKYRELENAEINEIVRAAKLTPDELANVLRQAGLQLDDKLSRSRKKPEETVQEELVAEENQEGEQHHEKQN